MADSIEYFRQQIVQSRSEIKNLRQQLSALKQEHQKEIKLIKAFLNDLRCSSCGDVATTISNRQIETSSTTENENTVTYEPIGHVKTCFQNKRAVPRQPTVMAEGKGTVVIDTAVFNNPEHALSGLEEFSHMWIIFHFHATESTNIPAKVAPPRLGGERRGVFSTRSPHRPCPIGLSLVKIEAIEDNKVHFLGVDMINGTPVLDIKPYIPQYDYPFGDTSVPSFRPPTEGLSDVVDATPTTVVGDGLDVTSLNTRISAIGVDTSYGTSFHVEPTSSRLAQNSPSPLSPSPESPCNNVGGSRTMSPTRRPDSERGAPDGQERFTPPQSAMTNVRHDGIRVASWITNPRSQSYVVRFTDEALCRLHELIGDRANVFKNNIESLLSEDPRSNYVRNRYPDHEYSCVLEDLSISCVFDGNTSVCTIIAVRNAEDLQDN